MSKIFDINFNLGIIQCNKKIVPFEELNFSEELIEKIKNFRPKWDTCPFAINKQHVELIQEIIRKNPNVQWRFDFLGNWIHSDFLKHQIPINGSFQIISVSGQIGTYFFLPGPGLYNRRHQTSSFTDDFCLQYNSLPALSFFFKKYFDISLQSIILQTDLIEVCSESSYFNPEGCNFYLFKTVKKMLIEIERSAFLLATDFEHEKLNNLKNYLSAYNWYTESFVKEHFPNENWKVIYQANKIKFIKQEQFLLADFYLRFVKRMRNLISYCGRNDLICMMPVSFSRERFYGV